MYVWEEVLTDYTDGMVCAYARSEKQAWKVLHDKDSTAWWVLQGRPDRVEETNAYDIPKCGYRRTAIRPRKITKPEAFAVWGGG